VSARGELFTFADAPAQVRSALAPGYGLTQAPDGLIQVRDERQKLVCRIQVRVLAGGSQWLTLAPLRGYERESERIRLRLEAGGLRAAWQWKQARVEMAPDEPAAVVVARVLQRLLEIQQANLPGVLAGEDAEFLHDLRVANRRARVAASQMRAALAPGSAARIGAELRWLGAQTAVTRDLEVLLATREAAVAELLPLRLVLERRLVQARAEMTAALSSPRAAQWEASLTRLVQDAGQAAPVAGPLVAELAAARIRRLHRLMVRAGRVLDAQTDAQAYHDLRKQGKALRYLLELFGLALFDSGAVSELITSLKQLQDVLGRHQDCAVHAAMLRELAPELAAGGDGAAALLATGALIAGLEAQQREAREQFQERFRAFASARQCKLVSRLSD
jgi:CHAD domain-containing protein